MAKRLIKSSNRVIAGVCGGIADYFDLDPTFVRLGYAFLSLFSACFPGLLFYIVAAIIMPSHDDYNRLDR